MTLRSDIHSALDVVAPAAPHLPHVVRDAIRDDTPQPHRRSRWLAAGAAVACAVALLALLMAGPGRDLARGLPSGHQAPAASPPPAPSGTPPPAPSGTPPVQPGVTSPSAPAIPSPSATAARLARCHTSDLTASIHALNSAAGQRYADLELTNRTSYSCTVYGYVGMLLLGPDHQPLPTNVVRNPPPPQPLVLAPGAIVHTVLHWTVVNSPGDSAPQCQPQPAFLDITPPDETTQLVLGWSGEPVCAQGRIDIEPLSQGPGPAF